jgi:hypothetical protein
MYNWSDRPHQRCLGTKPLLDHQLFRRDKDERTLNVRYEEDCLCHRRIEFLGNGSRNAIVLHQPQS